MNRSLLKNKLYALFFILLGVVSIWDCDMDGTFFAFSLMMGIPIFFSKTDIFDESQYYYDEEEIE